MDLVWRKAKVKMIGNGIVNGPRLAALTRMYVDAINGGAVPTIATAWQGVEEQESRRAAEEAEQAYNEEFRSEIIGEEADLEREHQRALQVAQQVFDSIALGSGEARQAGQSKFREVLQWRFEQFRDRVLAQAEQSIEQRLYNQTLQIQQIVRSEDASVDVLNATVDNFLMEYDENTVGPSKWPKLLEFMRNVYSVALQDIVQKDVSKLKQYVKDVQQKEVRLQQQQTENERQNTAKNAQIHSLQEQLSGIQVKLTDKTTQVQSLMQQLSATSTKTETAEVKVNSLQQQIEGLITEKEQAILNVKREAEQRVRELTQRQRTQLQEIDNKMLQKQNEVEQLESRLAARDKFNQDYFAQAGKREEELTRQLEMVKQEFQQEVVELDSLKACAENQVQVLQREKQELEIRMAQDHEKLVKAQQECQRLKAEVDQLLQENNNNSLVNVHVDPNGMTIKQIKNWLMERGHEAEVWQTSNRNALKKEWVELMNSKQ
eukprot:TRINITY_DN3175_c0_g1_i5.p1 TRINITY_DN3175_c0_g1~~TRINITY_DN3175_c0_g1_i5.p1  ORF type:complete len:490 (-),score=90.07 TRINITY_DN3175_c0_g1_i5:292-1761(-)